MILLDELDEDPDRKTPLPPSYTPQLPKRPPHPHLQKPTARYAPAPANLPPNHVPNGCGIYQFYACVINDENDSGRVYQYQNHHLINNQNRRCVRAFYNPPAANRVFPETTASTTTIATVTSTPQRSSPPPPSSTGASSFVQSHSQSWSRSSRNGSNGSSANYSTNTLTTANTSIPPALASNHPQLSQLSLIPWHPTPLTKHSYNPPHTLPPSNYVYIHRQTASIQGSYAIDPALSVPECLLTPLDVFPGSDTETCCAGNERDSDEPRTSGISTRERKRKHLSLFTHRGSITGEIWVGEGFAARKWSGRAEKEEREEEEERQRVRVREVKGKMKTRPGRCASESATAPSPSSTFQSGTTKMRTASSASDTTDYGMRNPNASEFFENPRSPETPGGASSSSLSPTSPSGASSSPSSLTRAQIHARTDCGDITLKIRATPTQRLIIQVYSGEGDVMVEIPRTFNGLLFTHFHSSPPLVSNSNLSSSSTVSSSSQYLLHLFGSPQFTPELESEVSPIMQERRNGQYFVGDRWRSTTSWNSEAWDGDELHIATRAGAIRVGYVDSRTSLECGMTSGMMTATSKLGRLINRATASSLNLLG